MTSLWCENALIGQELQPSVLLEVENGRFTKMEVHAEPGRAARLEGLTIPGLANAHSHAFHRALRSRTQADRGTFWTWRDLMYRAAERLDPDIYYRLARAVFAEMAVAGVTCVGEFHYLHHQSDGTPYADPNEVGKALFTAAEEAGIRITLLDTLYLHGGLNPDGHSPVSAGQRRFADPSAESWAERLNLLRPNSSQRVGAAIHSVRAVDRAAMTTAADWAATAEAPIHAHASEQVGENQACESHYGMSPISLLTEAGVTSSRFSAIHATHLQPADITALASSGSTVVMCPTTERDLGDGIGPTFELAEASVPMAVGSDSNAVIDLFEEVRALELDERLRSQSRGIHSALDLMSMATVNGHRSLGWPDAGTIAVGQRADLVTVALDSVRLAGTPRANSVEAAVFAASGSDITDVYVDGRHVISGGRHATIDVGRQLESTIKELMGDV